MNEAKKLAIESNQSLTTLIEDALKEKIGRNQMRAAGRSAQLPTFRGNGVRSGVKLDDISALRDLMDEIPCC